MENYTFGERLKAERKRIGATQAVFGQLGGVTKLTQLNYEKGQRAPDAAYLAALAEQGVDVLYVVTGERTPPLAHAFTSGLSALIEVYFQMSEEQRQTLERIATAMINNKQGGIDDQKK